MSNFLSARNENGESVWIFFNQILGAAEITPMKNMSQTTRVYIRGIGNIYIDLSLDDVITAIEFVVQGPFLLQGVDGETGRRAFIMVENVIFAKYTPPNLHVVGFFSPIPMNMRITPEDYNLFASATGNNLF